MTQTIKLARRHIEVPHGCLDVEVHEELWPLDELIGFGARDNPRRRYVFVSRVLGKHIPVRPSRMAAAHTALADTIPWVDGYFAVFGLAETATALGQGVAAALAQKWRRTVTYQQSTRHDLGETPWFAFEEPHSHASTHQVYRPSADVADCLARAHTLVLVDDEITSGTTLLHLTRALCDRCPAIRRVVWASLVSWLPEAARAAHETAIGKPLEVVALARGRFEFSPVGCGPLKRAVPVGAPTGPLAPPAIFSDPARRGIRCRPGPAASVAPAVGQGPWTVLGTGEFTYAPFQMALALERAGVDVLFQSTTRSPILTGGDILRGAAMPDPYGAAEAIYAYNLPSPGERRVAVVYEHASLADRDTWRQAFGAEAWIAGPACA